MKPSTKTAKPEQTAAEAYAARRHDIARLLDVLAMELEAHDQAANATPKDWGHAGSIGQVRSDLIELVAFMSNKNAAEVESFLNDAE